MQEKISLIGQRIRAIREKNKISREALAAKAEMDANYLGQIERGERNASLSILVSIAEAMNISLLDMLDIVPMDSNEIKEALTNLISEASDKQLRLLYKYAFELVRVGK